MVRTLTTNQKIAIEVIAGKWGNGSERRERLSKAGYDYSAIQTIVNSLLADGTLPKEETRITGTETKTITIDLTKYNSLEIEFTMGDSDG